MKMNKTIKKFQNRFLTYQKPKRLFKTFAIIACLLIAGAFLTLGGNVIVKDGQLNVTNDFFVGTDVLFVDSDENKVGIGTTSPSQKLEVAGNINVTGGQITFPATQSASANANTLDDYEEGTWTPGIQFGGGTTGITYGLQVGSYTKIGNRVFINGKFTLTSKGSSVGAAQITGLPFTVKNDDSAYNTIALRLHTITFADFPQGLVLKNTATIGLEEITNAGAITDLTNVDFADTSDITLFTMYITE